MPHFLKRLLRMPVAAALAAGLAACGLGSAPSAGPPAPITDPIVAATVNGRAIYVEDVRAHAVRRGLLEDGQTVETGSDAFHLALDELIQQRLFAIEAERRGLDREPEIRRQLELARERVLADAIYRELDDIANDSNRIAEVYRESQTQLAGRAQVRLRHILTPTREAAQTVRRRVEAGEAFAAVAFELSLDRASATDGGYLGEVMVDDLQPAFRDLAATLAVGNVGGPIQSEDGWHLIMLDSRSLSEAPSLESLRPAIISFLARQEVDTLYARLASEAQVVTVDEADPGLDPSESGLPAPEDAPAAQPPADRPAPVGPGALAAGSGDAAPAAAQTAPTPAPEPPPAQRAAAARPAPARSTPPPSVARMPSLQPGDVIVRPDGSAVIRADGGESPIPRTPPPAPQQEAPAPPADPPTPDDTVIAVPGPEQ